MLHPIIVSDKYGLMCESCYSDCEEFQDYFTKNPDSICPEIPGFRYAKEDEMVVILNYTACCESCGDPFETHLSESEKWDIMADREIDSDPNDIEYPEY